MIMASPIATNTMARRLDAITHALDQYREEHDRETLRALTLRLEMMSYDLAVAMIELDRYFVDTQDERTVWTSIRVLDRQVSELERHRADSQPDKLLHEVESAYSRAIDVFDVLLHRSKSAPTRQ